MDNLVSLLYGPDGTRKLKKPKVCFGRNYLETRWIITALLTISTTLNLIDRQTFSMLVPILRDKFHISVQGYSHIVAAFLLAYSAMYTFGGDSSTGLESGLA